MKNDNNREIAPYVRPLPSTFRQEPRNGFGSPMSQEELSSATGPREKSLSHYLDIVRRQRSIIIGITVLIVGIVGIYSFLATRLYTATAELKIGVYSPTLPGDGIEDTLRANTMQQDYLNTQVEQLMSLSMADRALLDATNGSEIREAVIGDSEQLRALYEEHRTGEPGDGYAHPLKLLRRYLSALRIEPIFKTSLVRIHATTPDPILSAKIANLHSRLFIEHARMERQKGTLDTMVFLQTQARELEERVAATEGKLADYAERNALITLEGDESLVARQITELSNRLADATAVRVKAEAAFNEAKSGSGLRGSALDDEAVRALRGKLREAEAEYAMLGQKFAPAYPRMQALRAEIEELRRNLQGERSAAITGLEGTFKAAVKTEEDLARKLEELKTTAYESSRKQVQYNILKREYDSLKDLHQNVLRQLKEAQLSSENTASNIIVSNIAAVPDIPSSPKRKLNLLLALGFGPILGFIAAMLRETFREGIQDIEEVHSQLGVPSLGVVPSFELLTSDSAAQAAAEPTKLLSTGDAAGGASANTPAPVATANEEAGSSFVTVNNPRSFAAEAFQTIRAGLLLSSADHSPQVVLVTSSLKGEGKTTIAANLAVALAQSGSNSIIIDCDLRRPALHKRFGLRSGGFGLADVLTGQMPFDEAVLPTRVRNLSLLSTGGRAPNPAALINSARMTELIAYLRVHYDFIVLDAPPVLPVADALVLSRLVDGVAVVLDGNRTPQREIKECLRRLRQVKAQIFGVIVNKANVRRKDYYADYTADPEEYMDVTGESASAG